MQAQAVPQGTSTEPPLRMQLGQKHLCCASVRFAAEPEYPREARLKGTTGDVVVHLVVRPNGSVDELQAVSGDPILMESTLKALRHWRIYGLPSGVCCRPIEYEMNLTFTFALIEPKPAFLHLWYGPPIRAEEVGEYMDGMEFLVGGRVYRIPSGLVAYVDSCRTIKVSPNLAPDECVPSGGPNFLVRALPLLPAKSDSTRQMDE
jgi:TonB family protein